MTGCNESNILHVVSLPNAETGTPTSECENSELDDCGYVIDYAPEIYIWPGDWDVTIFSGTNGRQVWYPLIQPSDNQGAIDRAYSPDGSVSTQSGISISDVENRHDPNASISCDPAPGSIFPVGNTTVTCNATSAAGTPAIPKSFSIIVNQVPEPSESECRNMINDWDSLGYEEPYTTVSCTIGKKSSTIDVPLGFRMQNYDPYQDDTTWWWSSYGNAYNQNGEQVGSCGGNWNGLPAAWGGLGTYYCKNPWDPSFVTTINVVQPPSLGISFENVNVSWSGSQHTMSGTIVNNNSYYAENVRIYTHITNGGVYETSRYDVLGEVPPGSSTFSITGCCTPTGPNNQNFTPYAVAFDVGDLVEPDNTPPVIYDHDNLAQTLYTTNSTGASLTFDLGFSDETELDGVECRIGSNSFLDYPGSPYSYNGQQYRFTNTVLFPIGTTNVICEAWDTSDNLTTQVFPVTVIYVPPEASDTTPPVVNVPGDITVTTSDAYGNTFVQWTTVTATDDNQITNGPWCHSDDLGAADVLLEGGFFAPGTYTVTCGATDSGGNITTESFTVTVIYVPEPMTATGNEYSISGDGWTVSMEIYYYGCNETPSYDSSVMNNCDWTEHYKTYMPPLQQNCSTIEHSYYFPNGGTLPEDRLNGVYCSGTNFESQDELMRVSCTGDCADNGIEFRITDLPSGLRANFGTSSNVWDVAQDGASAFVSPTSWKSGYLGSFDAFFMTTSGASLGQYTANLEIREPDGQGGFVIHKIPFTGLIKPHTGPTGFQDDASGPELAFIGISEFFLDSNGKVIDYSCPDCLPWYVFPNGTATPPELLDHGMHGNIGSNPSPHIQRYALNSTGFTLGWNILDAQDTGYQVQNPSCQESGNNTVIPVDDWSGSWNTRAVSYTFPIGVTTVTCTAEDLNGNEGSESFTVTILPPPADETSDTTPSELELGFRGISEFYLDSNGNVIDYMCPDCLPASTYWTSPELFDHSIYESSYYNPSPHVQRYALNSTGFTLDWGIVDAQNTGDQVQNGSCQDSGNNTVIPMSDLVWNTRYQSTVGASYTFPVGVTTVTCTAEDLNGNEGSKSFTVTILPPADETSDTTTLEWTSQSFEDNDQNLRAMHIHDNKLYGVSSQGGGEISIFNLATNQMAVIDTDLSQPQDIAVDGDGNMYVAQYGSSQSAGGALLKFDSNGELDWSVGPFPGPVMGVTIDNSGYIYAAGSLGCSYNESCDNQIKKFDSNGNLLQSFGITPSTNGCYSDVKPRPIEFGPDGNLWVGVGNPCTIPWTGNNYNGVAIVQKYTTSGSLVSSFGQYGGYHSFTDSAGVYHSDTPGNGEFGQYGPSSIDFDGGYMFAADYQNSRIQKFTMSGSFVAVYSTADENGKYCNSAGTTCYGNGPSHLAVDDGKFYVLGVHKPYPIIDHASILTLSDFENENFGDITPPTMWVNYLVEPTSSYGFGQGNATNGSVIKLDESDPHMDWSINVEDNVGWNDGGSVSCEPAWTWGTPATYPLGQTEITCTAIDDAGNTATLTFSVLVLEEADELTLPSIFLPSNATLTTTNSTGITTTYPVTFSGATQAQCPDLFDASVFSIHDESGNLGGTLTEYFNFMYPIGQTTLSCTATNGPYSSNPANWENAVTESFAVTVVLESADEVIPPLEEEAEEETGVDTVEPVITLSTNINLETINPEGRTVTYPNPDFSDNVGVVSSSCTPPSPSFFPVGSTIVTCTATDAAGNTASKSFTVNIVYSTVVDTTTPVFTEVPDANISATNSTGIAYSYAIPHATDNIGITVGPTCTPESGSTFPVGQTVVTCTATDAAGNQGTTYFTVTVTDLSAIGDSTIPTFEPVEDIVETAELTVNGKAVLFPIPMATDDETEQPDVFCNPSPGYLFPVGDTIVTCTAIDESGNQGVVVFTVTINAHPLAGVDASEQTADLTVTGVESVAIDGGSVSSLSAGQLAYFTTSINTNSTGNAFVTLNLWDVDDTPLGVGHFKSVLNEGPTELTLGFMIPSTANSGVANAYVNVFKDETMTEFITQTEAVGSVNVSGLDEEDPGAFTVVAAGFPYEIGDTVDGYTVNDIVNAAIYGYWKDPDNVDDFAAYTRWSEVVDYDIDSYAESKVPLGNDFVTDLTFSPVDWSVANLQIHWVIAYGDNTGGIAPLSTHKDSDVDVIYIGLGDFDEEGYWQPFSAGMLAYIVAHEIGHVIGFAHDVNPPSYCLDHNRFSDENLIRCLMTAGDAGADTTFAVMEYGTVELTKEILGDGSWSIPAYTSRDVTNFNYDITTDNEGGFNAYFVRDLEAAEAQYESSQQIDSYPGCFVEDVMSTGNKSCNNVERGSGLFITVPLTDETANKSAEIIVKLQENFDNEQSISNVSTAKETPLITTQVESTKVEILGTTGVQAEMESVILDGTEYMEKEDTALNDEIDEFSIVGWIKPNFDDSSHKSTIVSKHDSFNLFLLKDTFALEGGHTVIHDMHTLNLSLYDGNVWYNVNGKTHLSEDWHHVAMVFDDSLVTLYIDGEHEGQVELVKKVPRSELTGSEKCDDAECRVKVQMYTSDNDIVIGAYISKIMITNQYNLLEPKRTVENTFSGGISSMEIFNDAFTSKQITALYEQDEDYYVNTEMNLASIGSESPTLPELQCLDNARKKGLQDELVGNYTLICGFPFDVVVPLNSRLIWVETLPPDGGPYHLIESVDGLFSSTSEPFIVIDFNSPNFNHGFYNYYDELNESLTGTIIVAAELIDPNPSGNNLATENAVPYIHIAKQSASEGCGIDNSCYSPFAVQIDPRDTVTWRNLDRFSHSITSGTPENGPDGTFDSGLLVGEQYFSYKFHDEGVFDYYCTIHPWMKGIIIVGEFGES